MDSLEALIREEYKDSLFMAKVVMKSRRGITVVTVVGPAEPISDTIEKTVLKVKFFQSEPSLKQQLITMSKDARRIDGVVSFIPHYAEQWFDRIYTA
jgi:hypothetical protein